MKTVITFDNNSYTEVNNTNPVMTEFVCECSNLLHIPLAAVVLGITKDCGHCNTTLAANHELAITTSYLELIADEELVEF